MIESKYYNTEITFYDVRIINTYRLPSVLVDNSILHGLIAESDTDVYDLYEFI
jgi:hypothetical protein